MQQLTCIAPGRVEWRDVPAPMLRGDGEALVRPLAVARCDIDLVLARGLFSAKGEEPFALGHECVGEIAALGDAVRGLEIGQRVVVAFQISCGQCPACTSGHSAICERMPTLSDYGMRPLSGVEYGGMLSDLIHVPFAEAMLRPIPDDLQPADLASVSDNVLDGFRAVAPHLEAAPGSDVLVVSHGLASVPLYAVQAACALGAGRVDFASNDPEALAHARRLGARAIETDFAKPDGRYPIVVDAGLSPAGLRYAITSTRAEGVCQSVSFYASPETALPLGRMYTLGIRFVVSRAHACSLLPKVVPLIADGRLRPGEVTTRKVAWDEAPEAFLEPAVKLVMERPAE